MSKTLPLPLLDFLPSFFFFFSFSLSSFFSFFLRSLPPSLLHDSKNTVPSSTFLPRLLPLLLGHSFILSCFYFLPSAFRPANLCLSVLRFSRAISRKVLPEVRRFYYRFASLTRRPIFYFTKRKGRFCDESVASTMLLLFNFLAIYIFLGNRFIEEISSDHNHIFPILSIR